jgi:hypothetical protein
MKLLSIFLVKKLTLTEHLGGFQTWEIFFQAIRELWIVDVQKITMTG